MSTAIFSYPTYTQSKEFTTYDDSEDEDYSENYNNNNNYDNDFSMQEITQLNKLDKTKTSSGKTGNVIPLTNKNYQAAVEYKKAKRAAIKALHLNNSDSTTSTITSPKSTPTPSESEDTSSADELSNKTKKLTKSEVNSIITNEIDCKKKERLPSSVEVYNRILHDELLADKINDFIISYEDRFDGLLDVEFLKYEIGAIPLHRVKQIRHLNTIVWDRSERIYDFSKLFE